MISHHVVNIINISLKKSKIVYIMNTVTYNIIIALQDIVEWPTKNDITIFINK